MARRVRAGTRRTAAARRLKAAAAKDEGLLAKIRRGLEEEQKSGRVPLRDVEV